MSRFIAKKTEPFGSSLGFFFVTELNRRLRLIFRWTLRSSLLELVPLRRRRLRGIWFIHLWASIPSVGEPILSWSSERSSTGSSGIIIRIVRLRLRGMIIGAWSPVTKRRFSFLVLMFSWIDNALRDLDYNLSQRAQSHLPKSTLQDLVRHAKVPSGSRVNNPSRI